MTKLFIPIFLPIHSYKKACNDSFPILIYPYLKDILEYTYIFNNQPNFYVFSAFYFEVKPRFFRINVLTIRHRLKDVLKMKSKIHRIN